MTPGNDLPESLRDLRNACMGFVERSVGIALDGTPDTLSLVDHYLTIVPDRAAPEVLELIAPALGVYFGEVLRHHFGDGVWHCPSSDPTTYRVRFQHCFLELDPIGMAHEILARGERATGNELIRLHAEDRAAVEASLEELGPIRDDDYHRFAVRFEIIDQIHDHVDRRAQQRGNGDRLFTSADYDVAPAAAPTLH